MEDRIRRFAEKKNLLVGICDTKKLLHMEGILYNTVSPFMKWDIESRINPTLIMENGKSIIVLGLSYKKFFKFQEDNEKRGSFSMGAVGEDYHVSLGKHLNDLKDELLQYKSFQSKIFVDTGPLIERELAKKAGLGWQGKNCNIISEKFGSFFFIGYMITDLDLKVSKSFDPFSSKCEGCNLCIKACPGNALNDNLPHCNYDRCISYLTQKKGDLSLDEARIIGSSLYGCDICQKICPYNKSAETEDIYDINTMYPMLEDILLLTKHDFNLKYKNTAIGWRGKKILQRNALIALKNLEEK